MAGFFDEVKGIFSEDVVKSLAYATVAGIGSGILTNFLLRVAKVNEAESSGKVVKALGTILGAGLGAYIGDEYLKDRRLAYAGVFGALFPMVYNFVSAKVNPEAVGQKLALGLTGEWRSATTTVVTPAPVVYTPPVQEVGAPVPP